MQNTGSDYDIIGVGFLIFLFSAPLWFFFPWVLPFIAAGTLCYFGSQQLKLYKSAPAWIATKATLLKTDVGKATVVEGQGYAPVYYFPLAYFEYTFEGKTYRSNRYALDRKSIRNEALEKIEGIIAELWCEDFITVYVNPGKPGQSVINRNVHKDRLSHAYALIVGGVLVGLVGLVAPVLNWGH